MNKEDPFDGTWKLNPEKSQFDPNHRPSNATMRWECTSDGYTMTAEGIARDGSVVREKPAIFVPDGKDYEVPGLSGFTAAVSRPSPNVLEVESKNIGGMVGKASYVVSEDGKTLTTSVSSIDAQQRPFQVVLVWEHLPGCKEARP
ncbi:MAG: hypothetical protein WA741_01480 [Candidatus Sulfotelmatobacter sp.]